MNFDLVFQELQIIRRELKELRHDLTRYKGFVQGILWSIGAIAAIVGYFGFA